MSAASMCAFTSWYSFTDRKSVLSLDIVLFYLLYKLLQREAIFLLAALSLVGIKSRLGVA